jgi:hypothetical protein
MKKILLFLILAGALALAGCTVEVDGDGLRAYSPQANAAATDQVFTTHGAATATAVAIQQIATREAAVTIAKAEQAQAEVETLFLWARVALFGVVLPFVAFVALALARAAWGLSRAAIIRGQSVYPNERGTWPVIVTGSAVHNLDTSEVYALNAPKAPDVQQVTIGGAVRVIATKQEQPGQAVLVPIERG